MIIGGRVSYFLQLTPAKRRDQLNLILNSLDPLYADLYDIWVKNGATSLINPKEFSSRGWSDLGSMSSDTMRI